MATMREAYEILSNPAIPSFIKVGLHSVQSFYGSIKQNVIMPEVCAMSDLAVPTLNKKNTMQ